MADCPECGVYFSRTQNMLRHMTTAHKKEEEEIPEDESHEGESDDENSELDINADERSGDEKSDDEESDDGESDSGKSDEERDAEIYDMWTYLVSAARKDETIQAQFEELKEKLSDAETTEQEVAQKANLVLRPDILKHINEHYANFLKIWHFAKEDPYHKQIMKTKRKLIDMEDMSACEAIEQAVKKRKHLVLKATDLLEDIDLTTKVPALDLPEEEEEEEEADDDENNKI